MQIAISQLKHQLMRGANQLLEWGQIKWKLITHNKYFFNANLFCNEVGFFKKNHKIGDGWSQCQIYTYVAFGDFLRNVQFYPVFTLTLTSTMLSVIYCNMCLLFLWFKRKFIVNVIGAWAPLKKGHTNCYYNIKFPLCVCFYKHMHTSPVFKWFKPVC